MAHIQSESNLPPALVRLTFGFVRICEVLSWVVFLSLPYFYRGVLLFNLFGSNHILQRRSPLCTCDKYNIPKSCTRQDDDWLAAGITRQGSQRGEEAIRPRRRWTWPTIQSNSWPGKLYFRYAVVQNLALVVGHDRVWTPR